MKKIFFLIVLMVLSACSVAQMETAPVREVEVKAPAKALQMPSVTPRYVDIWLDTGASELGAYHLVIHYNPEVAAIHEILPAPQTSPGSNAAPMSKPETYASGKTAIIGIIPGQTGPTGRMHVAHVLFKAVADGRSPVSVSIKSLYDPRSKPIKAVVELSATELEVKK